MDDDPPLLNLHCWLKQLETTENTGPRVLTGVYYLLENISESTSHAGKLALDNSPNNVKYLSYYDHAARKKVMALLQAIDHRGEEDWAQKAVAALFQLDMRKVMEYLEMPSKNGEPDCFQKSAWFSASWDSRMFSSVPFTTVAVQGS